MTNFISNRWTDKQITYLKKHYGEKPIDELATHLLKTPSAIQSKVHYLRKRGWTFNSTRR